MPTQIESKTGCPICGAKLSPESVTPPPNEVALIVVAEVGRTMYHHGDITHCWKCEKGHAVYADEETK